MALRRVEQFKASIQEPIVKALTIAMLALILAGLALIVSMHKAA